MPRFPFLLPGPQSLATEPSASGGVCNLCVQLYQPLGSPCKTLCPAAAPPPPHPTPTPIRPTAGSIDAKERAHAFVPLLLCTLYVLVPCVDDPEGMGAQLRSLRFDKQLDEAVAALPDPTCSSVKIAWAILAAGEKEAKSPGGWVGGWVQRRCSPLGWGCGPDVLVLLATRPRTAAWRRALPSGRFRSPCTSLHSGLTRHHDKPAPEGSTAPRPPQKKNSRAGSLRSVSQAAVSHGALAFLRHGVLLSAVVTDGPALLAAGAARLAHGLVCALLGTPEGQGVLTGLTQASLANSQAEFEVGEAGSALVLAQNPGLEPAPGA